MNSLRMQENLAGRSGSYILPFIWYAGESREQVAGEIQAVYDSGAREFVFENRGGDWFATDFWWDIFKFVLDTAKSLNMRVWSLDDSHVNTGSANDSLSKAGNARFRAKNLRLDFVDIAGQLVSGAVSLPRRSGVEKIIRITAFQVDETSGETFGKGIDLTGNVQDGLCVADLPDGVWRIYFVMTTDPERHGVFKNYITMVSRDSCRHLINEVHEKVYAHFAEYFGNTFAGFFSDEPAFGNCDGQYGPYAYELRPGQPEKMFPWWEDFPERLAEKLKISPDEVMTLLPALWDDMQEVSPAFRLAYMDLITELWEENFSRQIGKWCEDHHVEYIGHNLEDDGAHMRCGWGCGHYFRSMSGQHMSGMDLVFDQLTPGISVFKHASNSSSRKRDAAFYHYTLPKLAASLAHQTPGMKNRALSEVFGATGWTCGVFYMHAIFNLCQVSGVNYFIPHAFSMSLPEAFEKQSERDEKAGSYTPPGYCLRYLPPTFYTGGYNPQFRVFREVVQCAQRISHLTAHAKHLPDVAVVYNAECDWMNSGRYQNLDEVTMTLSRGGYDYDILPLDILAESAAAESGRLVCGQEEFGALIVPGGSRLPEKLLSLCRKFSAAGVPVLVAGEMPEYTEYGRVGAPELKNCPVSGMLEILRQTLPPGFQCRRQYPDLRHYRLLDEENNELVLLFNSGIKELDICLKERGVIYDPWQNKLFALAENMPVILPSQKLLVFYPGADGAGLPEYRNVPEVWQTLELDYDISIKEAGNSEFRILRKKSRPVNLLQEENLTRCCAEFRYETVFETERQDFSLLEIPYAGEAAEVILNGESCGFDLGPVCRFDISGKVKNGINHLEIHTFDNPAYADRKDQDCIGYGAWFPIRQHGFTGDIKIG